ncbi:sensor histidine kinase [Streptomyces xanthii]|uniref:Two-component sensor histidine kinase n=1 Tax=Streptomyces xanthii TaxID=2768069 RepID=A0A7H1BBD5_9ACTN|nr:histidine kinase [Streptomyces xanthii]QNS06040.1 two-component sensor histidine kinase [Streptomyces xanthii]
MQNKNRFDRAGDEDGEGARPSPPKRSRDLLAPRVARTILVMALISYSVVILLNILDTPMPTRHTAVAIASLVVVLALQLRHSEPGANRAPLRRRLLTLGVQAALTYLPLLIFRAEWGAMAGFLAGSLLLLLPPRVGWSLYAVVGVSLVVPSLIEHRSVLVTVYLCQSTLLTGLVTYGLSRLSELVGEVHAARGELAHMAVTEERLRFARDLHDLLGFGLSTITLKAELVHRLIPGHPQRAMDEIQDVLRVARDSLADVRRVARGFQDMSLEQEISSARSVLSAADIELDVKVELRPFGARSDAVLAAVLREAMTNLLRHSKAGHCTIDAEHLGETVRLTVANDGVDSGYRDPSPDSGSGLANLGIRVRAIGGRVDAGCVKGTKGTTFRLVAEVPAHSEVVQPPFLGEKLILRPGSASRITASD